LKIAILSDVHSVASNFEIALNDARAEGFDHLVILGDLLTYGVEPQRTLDLAIEATVRDEAILICGNHDQMYLDYFQGRLSYFNGLPDWIKESVRWTCDRIDQTVLLSKLTWLEEWTVGNLIVAHANPFGYGDWSYLTDSVVGLEAAKVLNKRGFLFGVFGHVHRANRFDFDNLGTVVTVGSLGQPRYQSVNRAEYAMVSANTDRIAVEHRTIESDWSTHLAAINETSMSEPTKNRLSSFFK
jgi:predicted phosphodiesterase